jgi:hypothetical protein
MRYTLYASQKMIEYSILLMLKIRSEIISMDMVTEYTMRRFLSTEFYIPLQSSDTVRKAFQIQFKLMLVSQLLSYSERPIRPRWYSKLPWSENSSRLHVRANRRYDPRSVLSDFFTSVFDNVHKYNFKQLHRERSNTPRCFTYKVSASGMMDQYIDMKITAVNRSKFCSPNPEDHYFNLDHYVQNPNGGWNVAHAEFLLNISDHGQLLSELQEVLCMDWFHM